MDQQKFIYNLVFCKKLINELSNNRKKDISIEYFINHLNILNYLVNINLHINYNKYIERIPNDIIDKLSTKQPIDNSHEKIIEPYCKKPIKYLNPQNIFKSSFFHPFVANINSKYYNMLFIIKNIQENICGYVVSSKKNVYFVIDIKYDTNIYQNKNKKLSVINEICDEFNYYEKHIYLEYIKYYRDYLFSIFADIILNREHINIKNIIFIGNEKASNFIMLFIKDIYENIKNIIPKDMFFTIFQKNSANLTINEFYTNIFTNNIFINYFSNNNDAYKTWSSFIKDYKDNDNINIFVNE